MTAVEGSVPVEVTALTLSLSLSKGIYYFIYLDRAIGNAVVLLLMFAVRLHVSEAEKRFVPGERGARMYCVCEHVAVCCRIVADLCFSIEL